MEKIIVNIPSDLFDTINQICNLINRVKNIIFLIFIAFLLISSYINKYHKIFKRSKYSHIKIKKANETKICVCTLGKNENKYIKEFINHYKGLGVDKIFLYDNNNIGDGNETFETEVSEFVKDEFVKLIDYRGVEQPQLKIYSECFSQNNKYYDWFLFFDLDEYIHLENYSNIKDFLSEKRFNKCKLIYFNCFRHTDNDLLFYDNRTLSTRFPNINWKSGSFTLKTIASRKIKNIRFKTTHWLDRSLIGCDVFGEIVIPIKRKVKLDNKINFPKYKLYYIDHYCFKSTEEFINKINRGDGLFGFNNKTRLHKIRIYFNYNRITLEKINYIEQKTGLDLTEYRIKLNNSNLKLKTSLILSSNKTLIFYIILLFSKYNNIISNFEPFLKINLRETFFFLNIENY